jgi:hypothetical protein
MILPERQHLSYISIFGSGQLFCGSCRLSDWRNEAVFDHNTNMKLACFAGKLASVCLDHS